MLNESQPTVMLSQIPLGGRFRFPGGRTVWTPCEDTPEEVGFRPAGEPNAPITWISNGALVVRAEKADQRPLFNLRDVLDAFVQDLTDDGAIPFYRLEEDDEIASGQPLCFQPVTGDEIRGVAKAAAWSVLEDEVAAVGGLAELHECEGCGLVFTGEHRSDPECNRTGRGVVLCNGCGDKADASARGEG